VGGFDILVNNAALDAEASAPSPKISEAELDRLFAVKREEPVTTWQSTRSRFLRQRGRRRRHQYCLGERHAAAAQA